MKIAYHLPETVLTNDALSAPGEGWTAEKILAKTGIRERRVARSGESALDLAEGAARALFAGQQVEPASVDFLLLCTQSSDFRLPSSSCLLQHRLGLPTTAGALTIDHGCSGFIYGLSVAKGLLAGGMAKRILLVTAETYSKYIAEEDRATRTIFGDGAAAVLLDLEDLPKLGAFVFGTDGAGAESLIVRDGRLRMDGPEIFNFTLDVVPKALEDVLTANGLSRDDIGLYVFHQANAFMLDALRMACGLPRDRFHIDLEMTGNTVSSSLPLALKQLEQAGRLEPGMRVVLMGYGVGLSWGATVLTV